MLFTDALVITGALSNEEIAIPGSIGFTFFVSPGEHERMIADAGMQLMTTKDLTSSVERIAGRWHQARDQRRDKLLQIESEAHFLGFQLGPRFPIGFRRHYHR